MNEVKIVYIHWDITQTIGLSSRNIIAEAGDYYVNEPYYNYLW